MKLTQLFSGLLASALLLSACAPSAPAIDNPAAAPTGAAMPSAPTAAMTAVSAMIEEPAETAGAVDDHAMAEDKTMAEQPAEMTAPAGDAAMVDDMTGAMAERPAWQKISLTNAHTGAAFTLADFAGKTVFVEPFATWCSNCRQQLTNVQAARAALGEDVVFVALSVEPNIGADALVSYADDAGFDYIFAAMPQELLQALAAQYGQTVANPPATPHFIIRPDGSTTDLVTGIEAAEAIIGQIEAARG